MDKIILNGILASGFYGCTKEERSVIQDFKIDLTMSLDFEKSVKSDSLEDTIDYPLAIELVKNTVREFGSNLIETLAEEISKKLFTNFSILEKLEIEVKKCASEKSFHLDKVAVKIKRARKNY